MKSALVTGAAKRIGRAIAERLLAEGYRVVLHANTSFAELEAWVSAHPLSKQVQKLVQADLANERGQNSLIAQVSSSITALDLLVHNASAFSQVPFAVLDRAQYRAMMGINLDAPFFVTQGLLPKLMEATNPSVINIIDAMWERPSAQFSHYAASKAGLAILTRALANELAPRVRVNGVAPGAILFSSLHSSEEAQRRALDRIPFKRLGSPSDIADAVVFLSNASYASGEIIVIDGGRSIAS